MTCEAILKFFDVRGIKKERIILESFSPRNEFLDRYNEVDISLDSFPYGGGVTTIESLTMGVPVVTWHGDRWMSRASSSYLKVLGHEELVAKSLEDYVEIAVNLSSDITALENYRKNLREEIRSSEINAKNFVKHFENAVKEIVTKSA
jgi:predicted O-linked N-acetylglucosamine transferase (SPINDLY family)